MTTVIYAEPDGSATTFTGDDLEHCHEQYIDSLNVRWSIA